MATATITVSIGLPISLYYLSSCPPECFPDWLWVGYLFVCTSVAYACHTHSSATALNAMLQHCHGPGMGAEGVGMFQVIRAGFLVTQHCVLTVRSSCQEFTITEPQLGPNSGCWALQVQLLPHSKVV